MYFLTNYMEMKAKLSTLSRRLEELEMRNQHEGAMAETPVLPNQFFSFVSLPITKESIIQLFLQ